MKTHLSIIIYNNIYQYINRYIVDSGKFEISTEAQGKVGECNKGSKFGELALIYNAKRAATVTCVENAKLWALDRHIFRYHRYHLLLSYDVLLFIQSTFQKSCLFFI